MLSRYLSLPAQLHPLPKKKFLIIYLLPILDNELDHFQCPGVTQQQEAQQVSWLCLGRQVRRCMEGVSSGRPLPQCPAQSALALTNGLEDPAYCAISTTYQNPAIGNFSEESKPETDEREDEER